VRITYITVILTNIMSKSSTNPDLIAIGESLRDVFYFIHDATVSCSVHKDTCLLCLEYADKIPVQKIIKVPAAGNSANAAVGTSRLGLKSALVSWIGNDRSGAHIRAALEEEGVEHRYITTDKKHPTSESTLIIFRGERTQLVHFEPRTYTRPKLPKTKCIYYSAMGTKHLHMDRFLVTEMKKRTDTFFAFQPGTTHIRSGLKGILPLIACSDLFILNKDEAHYLLKDGERTMCNMLEVFYHYGAKTVVITDGKNGADAWDGKEHWHMPIFNGKVFEATGAGDGFATALTVAHLRHLKLPEALRWGTANGWSVIQEVGPQAGLLDRAGMKRVLRKFSKIRPTLHKH